MLSLLADTPTTGTAWWNSGAMAFIIEGGWPFMVAILFMAVLGLAVIIIVVMDQVLVRRAK